MSNQIPMFNGLRYERRVQIHLVDAFVWKGIDVYDGVKLGRTIMWKRRHLDLFLHHKASGRALAIECKYQAVSGTAEEKIQYGLSDAAAMPIPCVVAWSGDGFSAGASAMLIQHPLAMHCTPGGETWELDDFVISTFGLWEMVSR